MKNMHNDNLEPLSTDLEALRNLRLQSFINQVRKMLLIPTYSEDKAISKQFVISTDTAGCVHTGSKKGTWVCGRHESLSRRLQVLSTANLRALCPSNKRSGASSFCSTAWESSTGKLSWICRSNIPSGVPAPGAVYLATTVASWARCNLWRPEISDSDRSSQHSVFTFTPGAH
jgi:hypothetical protein